MLLAMKIFHTGGVELFSGKNSFNFVCSTGFSSLCHFFYQYRYSDVVRVTGRPAFRPARLLHG